MELNDESYNKSIISKMSNEENWPKINNIDLVRKLIEIADKQFANKSLEGYLSSILIYHQVVEELLINLLKLSNLYVQAEIWPTKLDLKIKDKLMFGQILEEHKRSINFDKKEQLLKECNDFNKIRIKFVHHLLKFKNESEIESEAKFVQEKFKIILDLYFEGNAFIEWLLSDLQKRVDWDEME